MFLAFVAGALMVFASMLPLVDGVNLVINGRDLNAVTGFLLLTIASIFALVLVCDQFSRNVESWLASWRAVKRSAKLSWNDQMKEEKERLEIA